MGAYEGAGVTVLGRGIRIPANSTDFWGASAAGGFPAGYQYLTNSNTDCTASTTQTNGRDYGTSNFLCNPSRVDGVTVINSSQGGGAIWAHGWNHNLEVSNTRERANHGTLTGGITIGNGEFPDPFIVGDATNPPPPGLPVTLAESLVTGLQVGYGFNRNVKVHHNMVTGNASIGDALYSGTPSAAGGITLTSGSDGYTVDHNWVCGNLSSGDAGGVAHAGFSNNGTIKNNWILFNQSQSPTIPTHGGGIAVLGASPDRTLVNGQSSAAIRQPTRLPAGAARRDRSQPADRRQPDHGQQRRERQWRRDSPADGQRPGRRHLPAAECRVERRHRHQQHHCQQRRGMGWWRHLDAGRVAGAADQQHRQPQRHHGFGGCAVQHPRCAAGGRAAAGLHAADRPDATAGPELQQPGDHVDQPAGRSRHDAAHAEPGCGPARCVGHLPDRLRLLRHQQRDNPDDVPATTCRCRSWRTT